MKVFYDKRQSVDSNKVCVSLAGGYQADSGGDISRVLALHDSTFRAGWQEYQQKRR